MDKAFTEENPFDRDTCRVGCNREPRGLLSAERLDITEGDFPRKPLNKIVDKKINNRITDTTQKGAEKDRKAAMEEVRLRLEI